MRIANPQSHQTRFTSRGSAERYVARGRARWIGERQIAFIEDTHIQQSVIDQATGYDRRGRLKQREIRRIPVVNSAELLREPTKPRVSGARKWRANGKVKTIQPEEQTS